MVYLNYEDFENMSESNHNNSKQKKDRQLPFAFYPSDPIYLGNASITHRQYDCLAILYAKKDEAGNNNNKTAKMLGIDAGTVRQHKGNFLNKYEDSTNHDLYGHIDKLGSQYGKALKEHYKQLEIEEVFRKEFLQKIKGLNNNLQCYLKCDESLTNEIPREQLKYHLKCAGIKILVPDEIGNTPYYAIYIQSKSLFDKESSKVQEGESPLYKIEIEPHNGAKGKITSVDFGLKDNYYSTVIKILGILLPKPKLNYLVKNFDKLKSNILDAKLQSNKGLNDKNLVTNKSYNGINVDDTAQKNEFLINNVVLLSDNAILLNRQKIIQNIKKKLSFSKEINRVTLVGIGGSGKSTLAQQYAKESNCSIIRVLNAETKEDLIESFEEFSYSLASTEKQRRELQDINDIRKIKIRDLQILGFVRKYLQQSNNWLLIFDNLDFIGERESCVDYLPNNSKVWGNGKVIITTKNNNIQNFSYLQLNDIIQIDKLSSEEVLKLFNLIRSYGKTSSYDKNQDPHINVLLSTIPPYPLDVSLAAYYIRDSKISCSTYLEEVGKVSNEFEATQNNLLKEIGNYEDTRYSIIALEFKRLINIHKDYLELLLLLCCWDSQFIPCEAMYQLKEQIIVTRFIHDLRKFSLIIEEELDTKSIFIVHRSIQRLGEIYLRKTFSKEQKFKKSIEKVLTISGYYFSNKERKL